MSAQTSRWQDIRPGDTIVVDEAAPLFLMKTLTIDGHSTVEDVFHDAHSAQSRGGISAFAVIRHEKGVQERIWRSWNRIRIENEANWNSNPRRAPELAAGLAQDLLANATESPWLELQAASQLEIIAVDGDAPGEIVVLARDPEDAVLDEDLRQVDSPRKSRHGVPLATHHTDVAARARSIALRLGLPDGLVDALERAGELHDEGKRDRRFQVVLGNESDQDGALRAKGPFTGRAAQRALRSRVGLTPGWRHEQRSAAHARALSTPADEADLMVRLVGTTHGYGRGAFADDAARLLPEAERTDERVWDAAVELFDEGEWEAIIERTHDRYGYWGAAYLESLLRVADMTISAEGR